MSRTYEDLSFTLQMQLTAAFTTEPNTETGKRMYLIQSRNADNVMTASITLDEHGLVPYYKKTNKTNNPKQLERFWLENFDRLKLDDLEKTIDAFCTNYKIHRTELQMRKAGKNAFLIGNDEVALVFVKESENSTVYSMH